MATNATLDRIEALRTDLERMRRNNLYPAQQIAVEAVIRDLENRADAEGMDITEALKIVAAIMTDDGMMGVGTAAITALPMGGFGVVIGHTLENQNADDEYAELPDWRFDDCATDLLTTREAYEEWYKSWLDGAVQAAERAAGWDPTP